jgi:hypothetical protein
MISILGETTTQLQVVEGVYTMQQGGFDVQGRANR